MISFLKKYQAFVYGLILFRIVVFILLQLEQIKIDNSEYLANTLSFLFYWMLFSLPIYYFPFLKKHKTISIKLVILFVFFSLIITNDANAKIEDNPITIIGIIMVGLSFFSIFAHNYLKKHILFVAVYYLFSIGYFLYLRVYINAFDKYLQQEKEIKIILIIPFLLLILGWIFHQWNWLKSLETKKTKAELSLLKSQINPHFFFNTLNNLYGLTVEKSDDAPNVVLKLSEMMRYTIYMGKEDQVPLQEEVHYLNNYIELHKIRYQKNVTIKMNVNLSHNHSVAPLLFIIALENAFKHGVEKLTENAYIYIDISDTNKGFELKIENNFEESSLNETPGIGLENLKQRLNLLYNKKHSLKLIKQNNVYNFSLKIDLI